MEPTRGRPAGEVVSLNADDLDATAPAPLGDEGLEEVAGGACGVFNCVTLSDH
jgi:hypothetical protein